jgi:2-oxoglutarate ferredoxin oxidoreductase subunit gamma
MRVEVRLAGEGGQGLILAGIILAEAAAIHDGLNAVQSQSYGPESRGGASKAEVVIDDGDIDYPKVSRPDVLLVMTQEAFDRYSSDLKPGGLLVVDSGGVPDTGCATGSAYCVPITALAREKVGKAITANIVALGLLVGLSGVVSRDALTTAVLDRVPKGTADVNLKALEVGFTTSESLKRPQEQGGR